LATLEQDALDPALLHGLQKFSLPTLAKQGIGHLHDDVVCLQSGLVAVPRQSLLAGGTGGEQFYVAALGCLLRIWGTGHLRKNKVLATGGPYAHVRHPLYVGTFLVLVGLGLMAGSDYVLFGLLPAAVLIYLAYYAPKKERVESKRLEKNFGEEFVRYRKAVRGYFPRLTPYPDRKGRFSLEGVMLNREYLITLSVAFGVAVILAKYVWLRPEA